jgi:hypothetical protein
MRELLGRVETSNAAVRTLLDDLAAQLPPSY